MVIGVCGVKLRSNDLPDAPLLDISSIRYENTKLSSMRFERKYFVQSLVFTACIIYIPCLTTREGSLIFVTSVSSYTFVHNSVFNFVRSFC